MFPAWWCRDVDPRRQPFTPGRRAARTRHPRLGGLALEPLEGRFLPSFIDSVLYDVGSGPIPVATADLNGDGRIDLVTANSNSTSVSVLLGKGDGSFWATATAPFRTPSPTKPEGSSRPR